MLPSPAPQGAPAEIALAVVIPAHRQPGLLAEAVASVLAQQDAPPTAAIVVDDGCPFPETSATALRLAAAHPGRVFVLRRRNGGLSAARNTGIEFALAAFPACRGIFFLDADNRLRPPFLARAFAALEAAPPEVGWLYPDIDEIGRTRCYSTGGDFMLLALLSENYCEAGSLVRREVFEAGARFDESLRAGFEDWDFWLQAAALGFAGRHLPASGFLYRRRPESMLAEAERQRPVLLEALRRKHAALLHPRRLLALEAREAPRYALFSPDQAGVRLLLDPAREAVETLSPDAMRERLLAGFEAAEARHVPPVLVFATEATLSLLRTHGVIRGLFRQAEIHLREAEAVALEIEGGTVELALEPQPAGGIGEAPVIFLRSRSLLAGSMPESKSHRLRLTLPQPDVAEIALPGAFRHLEQEAASLDRARRRRTALAPGWRQEFRHPRQGAAERAYALSGLGAMLPCLPEPGRRDFGFILPLFTLGGVERVVLNQARVLRGRGWRVHLFVLGAARATLPQEAHGLFESITLLHGTGETEADWRSPYFAAETAAWGDRPEAADALGLLAGMDVVLNTHSLGAHALMARLRRLGIRTFCGLHLVERTAWGNPLGTPHSALAYEHAYDGITVISEQLRRWCIAQGMPAGKLHLLRNAPAYPTSPERIAGAMTAREARQGGRLRALFLGRLDAQKGLDRLAAVIARTRDKVEWRVAGRPVLDAPPPDLGVPVEPPALGARELDALYAWADVVLLPSRFEGVPLTVLEAQRMGCAVIATDVGAVSEAIEDGTDGFLVPGDMPEAALCAAMAEILLRLDAERPLLHAVGRRAAARLAGADWEAAMRDFLHHLDLILPEPLQ
ncbi:MAG: glycosyltransferase [Acetobacteraceae bacterium]|nr:glycosyltransferase [Acetobacteraceae bacterium]